MIKYSIAIIFLWGIYACSPTPTYTIDESIDRHALVERHKVVLSGADSLDALTVGNGEFAFTVGASGLQSFPAYYENGMSLGTQSQWGWHSYPNEGNYQLEEVLKNFATCNDKTVSIATQHKEGRAAEATNWLRANPHRLHLGLVGLDFTKQNGDPANITDLKNIHQELDLWTGAVTSRYEIDGTPVLVELYAHQSEDMIGFRIESPLLETGRLKVNFRFPYGKECHVCPGYDFSQPEKHLSEIAQQTEKEVFIKRTLDDTEYAVGIQSTGGQFSKAQAHHFELTPDPNSNAFACTVHFSQNTETEPLPGFAEIQQNSHEQWEQFWSTGGVIDFSECSDPRAIELERRVVLSQYLTKIQCAGSLPPQETGLTFNSWYGKFHLEMHWWHGVHFALWDRISLLEKSMDWYSAVMDEARKTAQRQGFDGVRWQKMSGPEGHSSPSSVGEFLIWQQPHPIYFAELFYRNKPDRGTLERYQDIIFQTADFMASFAQLNEADGFYHLCHPIIPAQEIFHATETDDPPFELAYWHFGLSVAQEWRKRIGLSPNEKWQNVIDHLAPLPESEGLYLPAARAEDAYTNDDNRRDHPIVTGVYGMLPGTPALDASIMAHTFSEIMKKWNWQTTWGWDYPMLAMCAARLGDGEAAVDALLLDVQKNTYLPNGHNYQDGRLRIYLPGNGGLLTAVAMMAAGWDGSEGTNPGFPKDGKWNVKWEGLKKMP